MNSKASNLTRQYAAALGRYLTHEQELVLQQAYELGREASASGLGVLAVARIHQSALTTRLSRLHSVATQARIFRAAEVFFMETLSPFEAAHRGFCEANRELHQLNSELERRNTELQQEINERKRAESELHQSREHYRELFKQACIMQENLRDLSNQILHVQEEERKNISRELHDEVGQALTAIDVNLALLQRDGHGDPAAIRQKIADSQILLRRTMDIVHDFARELRPSVLDDLGLVPALRSYVQRFAERTRVRARLEVGAGVENLTSEQKTVVFRVAQESLTNVARHAHASRVRLSLRKLGNALEMRIKDNGRSFQVNRPLTVNGSKRLGLVGMRERVRLVNGRFAIESAPGNGTTVRVEIPFLMTKEKPTYAKNKRAIG